MSSRTLPANPDLDQLRRQAKELHHAATAGDTEALTRISAVSHENQVPPSQAAGVSQPVTLHVAHLTLAREYGFPSWQRLRIEVQRLRLIATGDVDGLAALLATEPELAIEGVHSPIGREPMPPLHYVGIGLLHGWWQHDRAGELTRVLLAAGADAAPAEGEPPLVTAASHGEPGMVRVLIEAGVDVEARGWAAPGSATALAHAVHYGIVTAVDELVAAGAVVHDIVEAAGVGDIDGYLRAEVAEATLAVALRAAAVCERLSVIDELLDTGLDVNSEFTTLTEPHGATALHCAAWEGKETSVGHLLTRGADPRRTVPGESGTPTTPLDWCRRRAGVGHGGNHAAVDALLAPLTT